MPAYKLTVIKRPLTERIPDIKPNFPPMNGLLHLDLIENKKKLKAGLPLIQMSKNQPPPQSIPTSQPQGSTTFSQPQSAGGGVQPQTKTTAPEPRSQKKILTQEEEDRILEQELRRQLGEDVSDDEGSDTSSNLDGSDAGSDEEYYDDGEESGDEFEIPIRNKQSPAPSPQYNEPIIEEAAQSQNDSGDAEAAPQEEPMSEEDLRKEYLLKFKLLKKGRPDYADYPEYTEHTDGPTLKKLYDDTFKMISIDENVSAYKQFLVAGFFGIELLGCKVLHLPFEGFAKYQLKKQSKYDRMLIELGEKPYMNFASNWPVEVRLVGVLLLDALIFYGMKLAIDYWGPEVAFGMSTLFGMPLPETARGGGGPRDGKPPQMRGPQMKPEDIRRSYKTE